MLFTVTAQYYCKTMFMQQQLYRRKLHDLHVELHKTYIHDCNIFSWLLLIVSERKKIYEYYATWQFLHDD